jgi:23S rRNA pseudoU1915 N3-methylase RlmH
MKKIDLICIGDLKFKALKELEQKYVQKINFFIPFTIRTIKDVKSHDDAMKMKKEGEVWTNREKKWIPLNFPGCCPTKYHGIRLESSS